MTPPEVVTSEDGKKTLVVVFKHDWSTLGKRKTPPSAFDIDCPICDKPFTPGGNHRVCCLPCGHMYGMSCINSLLQQSQSSGKCPTCKTLCTLKDVRLLYPARTDSTLLKQHLKLFWDCFLLFHADKSCPECKSTPGPHNTFVETI
ncbi:Zinc finger, RING/FYVE/PHD-type [Artemisia annua]|uniref:Zinc finger, RING/FYVE/PHD-type n=1 Tax=Artemisia annua TaxID=35608 RepID=A0A2U1M570_ARTAN|nr:Zinc finger, RING/FYVE/PHD-type [Artemisia annua]